MTQILAPRALIVCDFRFTEDEITRLEKAAKIQLSKSHTDKLSVAFGSYLGGTIILSHSCPPKKIRNVLAEIKKPLEDLLVSFNKFWGVDGLNALVIESLSPLPSEQELLSELLKMFRLKSPPPRAEEIRKNDPYLVAGHLIDLQLNETPLTTDPFDIAYLLEVFRITLHSIEAIENDIAGTGGRPGDPYFTTFLIDLLNVICGEFQNGPYDSDTVEFIHESRQIIAERLEAMDMKKEKMTLMHLSKSGIIDRIKAALYEDAQTDRRATFKEI